MSTARPHSAQWARWLEPISDNELSGIDTRLSCTLAKKLLTTTAKDIRIATYDCWARLHHDGETGFAEGLELPAGLLQLYGMQLHPQPQGRAGMARRFSRAGQSVIVPGGYTRHTNTEFTLSAERAFMLFAECFAWD